MRHIGDILAGRTARERKALTPMVFDAEFMVGTRVMWVHDLLRACGVQLAAAPFMHRACELARIFNAFGKMFRCVGKHGHVRLFRKGWWAASDLAAVLTDPRNKPNDGLIFQCEVKIYDLLFCIVSFPWGSAPTKTQVI